MEHAGCSFAEDGETSWTALEISSRLAGEQVDTGRYRYSREAASSALTAICGAVECPGELAGWQRTSSNRCASWGTPEQAVQPQSAERSHRGPVQVSPVLTGEANFWLTSGEAVAADR